MKPLLRRRIDDPVERLSAQPDFLPEVEGRITTSNEKWRRLSPRETAEIQASREDAMGLFFARAILPNEKKLEDQRSLWLLQYHPDLLSFYRKEVLDALDKKDTAFFVRLGELLKKAKRSPRKVMNDFARHILQGRLALFLFDRWLSKPLLSDTVFWSMLHTPQFRSAVASQLDPKEMEALDSPLGYVCAAGLFKPVENPGRFTAPGLCFFSYGALSKVCRFLLQDSSITRDAVVQTIHRSGLKRCTRRELMFTRVENQGDKLSVFTR